MAAEPGFDWDQANMRHLARHQVTPGEFEDAMSGDPIILHYDDVGGEDRWMALGATASLGVLVFTMREARVRPVTAYKASRKLAGYFW